MQSLTNILIVFVVMISCIVAGILLISLVKIVHNIFNQERRNLLFDTPTTKDYYSNFSKQYRHVGYSYPGVPVGWQPIVAKALVDIEKAMWPRWLPMFLKRWIHYFATGNTAYWVKYRWAYNLRQKLTKGQIVTDVKEKYASLRLYFNGGEVIEEIVSKAEKECEETCQMCGGKSKVQVIDSNWMYNLCEECAKQEKEKIKYK